MEGAPKPSVGESCPEEVVVVLLEVEEEKVALESQVWGLLLAMLQKVEGVCLLCAMMMMVMVAVVVDASNTDNTEST